MKEELNKELDRLKKIGEHIPENQKKDIMNDIKELSSQTDDKD
jgi:hypothetical protein